MFEFLLEWISFSGPLVVTWLYGTPGTKGPFWGFWLAVIQSIYSWYFLESISFLLSSLIFMGLHIVNYVKMKERFRWI